MASYAQSDKEIQQFRSGSPRTLVAEIEKVLVEIWTRALELSHIDPHDDFFELGGDSLNAVAIMDEIRNRYRLELGLATLYHCPTIASLAMKILDGSQQEWSPVVAIRPAGSKPPLFFVHPLG